LLEEAAADEGQIEVLNRFRGLKSGHLILVPADGTNLREIYFADIRVPKQQRLNQNFGRLVRF